jgi:hypothetical protein
MGLTFCPEGKIEKALLKLLSDIYIFDLDFLQFSPSQNILTLK